MQLTIDDLPAAIRDAKGRCAPTSPVMRPRSANWRAILRGRSTRFGVRMRMAMT